MLINLIKVKKCKRFRREKMKLIRYYIMIRKKQLMMEGEVIIQVNIYRVEINILKLLQNLEY